MASSLDILRPSPSPPTTPSPLNPTARDLENRALKFANIMTTRNFSDPMMTQLTSPDFQCQIELPGERLGMVQSRAEFINHYSKHTETRILDVSNVTTQIDEHAGLAKVMLLLRIADSPKGRPQEAVTSLWWRMDKGAWRCYKQIGMRGVSGYRI